MKWLILVERGGGKIKKLDKTQSRHMWKNYFQVNQRGHETAQRSEPGKQKRILTHPIILTAHCREKKGLFSWWEGYLGRGDKAQYVDQHFILLLFFIFPSGSSLDRYLKTQPFLGWQRWQLLFFFTARKLPFPSLTLQVPRRSNRRLQGKSSSSTAMIELWKGNSISDEPNHSCTNRILTAAEGIFSCHGSMNILMVT